MGKTAIALIGIMVFFGSCNMRNSAPLVIGHRGAMGHETENTLASVKKAMELNADMIEIDVFKIDSGEIVVFHDERLERLSNAGGRIEDYNIFDLRQVVLDGNHQIPMLQDVLKLINNQTTLNIELKGADTANRVNFILDYYVREKGWSWDNFLISSFNWDELKKMREANPDIAIAVLTEEDPLQAIPVAKELNAVAINPDYRQLTQEIVDKIQDAGFKVYTWTVNNPEDIEKMKEFGVDGIISDYPERVR
nr:glycerophosphodiester phosphodiesterase family protein [Allomuricauda sp.]|tara:strand:+ start:1116 stop:1868 length:753 start_codon:yes stop_codon:yes gene_type:complete